MKSYVYTDGSLTIIHRVQAASQAHAIEKLKALYGIDIEHNVMTYADFKADKDAALEPMGLAPWQKKLTRETKDLW